MLKINCRSGKSLRALERKLALLRSMMVAVEIVYFIVLCLILTHFMPRH